MTRQALDDGGWFDTDAATKFKEDTYWDGSNHISHATRSKWEHEALYRTRNKKWVLNHWSQWQGVGETYVEVTDAVAAQWLVVNGHEHPDAEEAMAALEV